MAAPALTTQQRKTIGEYVRLGWFTGRFALETDPTSQAFLVTLDRVPDDTLDLVTISCAAVAAVRSVRVLYATNGPLLPHPRSAGGPAQFVANDSKTPIRYVEALDADGVIVGLSRDLLPGIDSTDIERGKGPHADLVSLTGLELPPAGSALVYYADGTSSSHVLTLVDAKAGHFTPTNPKIGIVRVFVLDAHGSIVGLSTNPLT